MEDSEFFRIKQKMINLDPKKYWGDDFDIRFYLISKLKTIERKKILDLGGGIGIISSELERNNDRINLDFSFEELKICNQKIDKYIQNICATITDMPFKNDVFDFVISSSVIQYARDYDITNEMVITENKINQYPSVEKSLSEMYRVLRPNGKLFLVTPNNAYYKSYMFSYKELKKALSNHFVNYSLSFFNPYPKLSQKYGKLNMANVIPKLKSKLTSKQRLLNSLIKKDDGHEKQSVSFYVEALKN